jgi:hypothetical protein
MQWADAIKPPSNRMLRQFAGLWILFFLALAGLRWYRGHVDHWTIALAVVAVVVGTAGLIVPALIRPIYTGWMIAAFPIGWTISRVVLGVVFYGVLSPLGWLFRARGRDALRLRRTAVTSYWLDKAQPEAASQYFRQS